MGATELLSAEELLAMNVGGKRVELVRGRLVVREPAGFRHGFVAMEVAARMRDHARRNGLGVVLAAETGFTLSRNPDTVRAPDAAFISSSRVPDDLPAGYSDVVPDLVVEVQSPDDRAGELLAKVGDWLTAGCRLVWVVDPERREARIYRADGSASVIAGAELLDGEDVLPGFACALASLWKIGTS